MVDPNFVKSNGSKRVLKSVYCDSTVIAVDWNSCQERSSLSHPYFYIDGIYYCRVGLGKYLIIYFAISYRDWLIPTFMYSLSF